MISAFKAKEVLKIDILKMSLASLKNFEIEKGEKLTPSDEEQIIRKEVKKLKDAFEEYTQAGRDDLAKKEKAQLDVLESYLPKLMSEDEIRAVVEQKAKEVNAESIRDIGKVMGTVMKELQGKADGTVVNNIVKEVLNEI